MSCQCLCLQFGSVWIVMSAYMLLYSSADEQSWMSCILLRDQIGVNTYYSNEKK